ncbi:uncharacterized protein LOC127877145 isoform X3 [Dreissena polymorpha]|nr:uncharacterized protein LOC127831687 isoform X3 [Dreissena polymorpha]XP_052278754.1 uncharacterized protein LOC127877145 isoform X3 [Dreissena polymorpha]
MNISAVTEPRKEYTDYRVGDVVKARCGSFGVVPAIIGKIGGKSIFNVKCNCQTNIIILLKTFVIIFCIIINLQKQIPVYIKLDFSCIILLDKAEKKDLEKLLSMPQMFSTLIDSFIPEILVMKNEGNGLPKMSSEETASSSDNLEETVSKAADANNQKQTGNGSKEVKNPTVVKPKAVRRKLSIVPYEVRNPKVLQSDAEDRALASFHVQMEIEQTEIDQSENSQSSSQLLGDSLKLLNSTGMTPRKSPRQNNKSSSSKPQNHETVIKQLEADNKALQSRVERLEGDNQDLQSRVGYLEYQAGILWSELEQMKLHSTQIHALRSPAPTFSPRGVLSQFESSCTSAFSKPDSQEDEQSVGKEEETSATSKISEKEPSYNGYVKSQILELLDECKDFKKGTAMVFRKIFTEEEIRGRSLSGGISKDGTRRPALEDQKKIIFLEEVIKEKWPSTTKDTIKFVLRDLLKPSRSKKS